MPWYITVCAIVGGCVIGIFAALFITWIFISVGSRIESEIIYRKNRKKGNLSIKADKPRRFGR